MTRSTLSTALLVSMTMKNLDLVHDDCEILHAPPDRSPTISVAVQSSPRRASSSLRSKAERRLARNAERKARAQLLRSRRRRRAASG